MESHDSPPAHSSVEPWFPVAINVTYALFSQQREPVVQSNGLPPSVRLSGRGRPVKVLTFSVVSRLPDEYLNKIFS